MQERGGGLGRTAAAAPRRAAWDAYLAWAVAAFRLATSAVADSTSIHTHMCNAEFNDIKPALGSMVAAARQLQRHIRPS
jgi:methionine synthase II (cobalamin-independent)